MDRVSYYMSIESTKLTSSLFWPYITIQCFQEKILSNLVDTVAYFTQTSCLLQILLKPLIFIIITIAITTTTTTTTTTIPSPVLILFL